MVRRSFGIGSAIFAVALMVGGGSAFAQANVMKACGAEWQAAKDAKKVKPGETWNSFLAECRKRQPAAAATEAAKPPKAVAKDTKPAKPVVEDDATPPEPAAAKKDAKPDAAKKPLTPGQIAAHERIKKCGAEWTAAKEAKKIKAGQKWPQYWSECNKRLKAAGQ